MIVVAIDLFSFNDLFFLVCLIGGAAGGIRTPVGGRPNGFQDRLVMTSSILPHSENPLGAESREGIIGDDKAANGAQEPERYITGAIEPTEIRRRAFEVDDRQNSSSGGHNKSENKCYNAH